MTVTKFPRPSHSNPRAASFELWDCGDPTCGLHVISFDAEGRVILETVMSPAQTLHLIETAATILRKLPL